VVHATLVLPLVIKLMDVVYISDLLVRGNPDGRTRGSSERSGTAWRYIRHAEEVTGNVALIGRD
jgi:hypothetical protein